MRILSPFKDYYDFISHQIGADPDCTYVRSALDPKKCEVPWSEPGYFYNNLKASAIEKGYSLEYLIAGSHSFTILKKTTHREDRPDEVVKEVVGPQHYKLFNKTSFDWRKPLEERTPALPGFPKGELLNSLIRSVGAPVFVVKDLKYLRAGKYCLLIDKQIPILKDLGVPKYVSAQVMWQDIYTALTSVLRHNPDKAPPVQLQNDDRIHAAGFDPKTSFRHPVNIKKL